MFDDDLSDDRKPQPHVVGTTLSGHIGIEMRSTISADTGAPSFDIEMRMESSPGAISITNCKRRAGFASTPLRTIFVRTCLNSVRSSLARIGVEIGAQ